MGDETDATPHERCGAHKCGDLPLSHASDPRVVAFPETRWTLVLGASGFPVSDTRDALKILAERYRPAVCQWFKWAGATPEDAEDLSQEFVVDLLQGSILAGFRRKDTRFRVFLQTCLRNFLRSHLRRQMAKKRGGGMSPLELHEALVPSPEASSFERLDEEFALLVHQRALERVGLEWDEKGLQRRFDRLERFMFTPPAPGDYEAAARDLAISMSVVKKTVFDLRQTYYQEVREQIMQTAAREDVAAELRFVVDTLARRR